MRFFSLFIVLLGAGYILNRAVRAIIPDQLVGATLPYTLEERQESHYEEVKQYFLSHQADFEALRDQVQRAGRKSRSVPLTPQNNALVKKLGLSQASRIGSGPRQQIELKAYDPDRRLGHYSFVYSESMSTPGKANYRKLTYQWYMNQSYEP